MKKFRSLIIALFLFTLVAQPAAVVSGQVSIPTGATITSATLSLYLYTTDYNPVTVHRATAIWNETTVTWASFAASYDAAVLGGFTPSAIGWQSVDVTGMVQRWVDGDDPNYGFVLRMSPPPTNDDGFTRYYSSESDHVAWRPKLDVCYTVGGGSETCITIQRAADETGDVQDTYIRSDYPSMNFGDIPVLFTDLRGVDKDTFEKQTLVHFDFTVDNPSVQIIKYTNGQVASDPNGADVPRIAPGQQVVWTYRVSNSGNVSFAREEVVVTDDQPGVNPAFDSEMTGNGDTVFDPGEVWWYKATGTAVNLEAAPGGVITYPNLCTKQETEAPRTAYINQGMVNVPGDSANAQSSYCNPPGELNVLFTHYLPILNRTTTSLTFTPFSVTIGYEDLPLDRGQNDYDYNDWIIDILGTGTLESETSGRWASMNFEFSPNGRGAMLLHAFHMRFPANTFSSSGSYTLTTYGPDREVIATQTGVFNAGADMDFNVFPNTGVVFPANFSNTFEADPTVPAQRTAALRINFDTPILFNFADYDYSVPHGAGLFFDPYIAILNSTREIHRGDLRLLNVPEVEFNSPLHPYEWPEEWVRIDWAYPSLTFIPANPPTQPIPDIIFPDNWWLNNNNCVIDDVACPIDVRPTNPLDFEAYNR